MAQSPQLAKQMAISADFERVFEIGPGTSILPYLIPDPHTKITLHPSVFRAENSNSHRHMTEFTGLDLEMAIHESYEEVVDTLDSLLLHIFSGLQQKYSKEIAVINKQFPAEPFLWLEKTLRLKWADGIALLREAKVDIGDFDDLTYVWPVRGGIVCVSG